MEIEDRVERHSVLPFAILDPPSSLQILLSGFLCGCLLGSREALGLFAP